MKQQQFAGAVAAFALACAGCTLAAAQDKGMWRAVSSTARSITGDVVLSNEKISLNYASFPLAQIRALKPEEITGVFDGATPGAGGGSLYRLSIPASKILLHHNTLCGSDDTQWVVTFGDGKNLQLAFFSGQQMPVLTAEAIANTTNLCGTFSYER